MSLCVTQLPIDKGDWRETARRYAAPFGLEAEVLAHYDYLIREGGYTPQAAAWEALYSWDLCDLKEDD